MEINRIYGASLQLFDAEGTAQLEIVFNIIVAMLNYVRALFMSLFCSY
jgi:hypothetical protein